MTRDVDFLFDFDHRVRIIKDFYEEPLVRMAPKIAKQTQNVCKRPAKATTTRVKLPYNDEDDPTALKCKFCPESTQVYDGWANKGLLKER